MASDEMLTMDSSSIIDEEYYEDGFHYQTRRSSLSRLSICTSSFHEEEDDEEEDNYRNHPSDLSSFISRMSLESFNDDEDDGAEADGEISDDDDDESDSDQESYSLPTIISRRRRKNTVSKQRRVLREKSKRGHGFNGDSDGDGNCYSGGGGELTVLTEVKGGKKSMKMGFEEVKACRDLGFDLEVSGRVLISTGSNRETQTSSGGNSPIANWRISSAGDDPKEVKARLKMWAQAVALASASR